MESHTSWVFATDIDGTLTGNRKRLVELTKWLEKGRRSQRLILILCTGRTLAGVLEGQTHEGVPLADGIICQVGTEIYLPPFHQGMAPLEDWEQHLNRRFSREFVVELLQGFSFLNLQSSHYNTNLKVSYNLEQDSAPAQELQAIQQRLSPYLDTYQMVHSSGKHLDILPANADKGKALLYLLERLGIPADRTLVAGDSGNDGSMFLSGFKGILVGNAQDELIHQVKTFPSGKNYFSSAPFAAGVLEGLEHFGIFP